MEVREKAGGAGYKVVQRIQGDYGVVGMRGGVVLGGGGKRVDVYRKGAQENS